MIGCIGTIIWGQCTHRMCCWWNISFILFLSAINLLPITSDWCWCNNISIVPMKPPWAVIPFKLQLQFIASSQLSFIVNSSSKQVQTLMVTIPTSPMVPIQPNFNGLCYSPIHCKLWLSWKSWDSIYCKLQLHFIRSNSFQISMVPIQDCVMVPTKIYQWHQIPTACTTVQFIVNLNCKLQV